MSRIGTNTSNIQEFEIPFAQTPFPANKLPKLAGRTALACAIQPGSNGHIYASNGLYNQLVRVNVTTKKVDVFTPQPYDPAGDLQPFNDLYRGPTGMYFMQTTGNVVTHFDHNTHEFRNYPVPTPSGSPLGMFVSHDGYAWVGPAVICVETFNRYMYFTSFLGNAIGRIDEQTGEIKAFRNDSPGTFAAEDTLDIKCNVWFSTATQNRLKYLTPSTGKITHIDQPGSILPAPVGTALYFVKAAHYGPSNSIYFTKETASRVGRY